MPRSLQGSTPHCNQPGMAHMKPMASQRGASPSSGTTSGAAQMAFYHGGRGVRRVSSGETGAWELREKP